MTDSSDRLVLVAGELHDLSGPGPGWPGGRETLFHQPGSPLPARTDVDAIIPLVSQRVGEAELAGLLGCDPTDVLRVSGKTGDGVGALLDRIVREVPAPTGDLDAPTRAMIFDSVYDTYRGVVTYVKVVDGGLKARD